MFAEAWRLGRRGVFWWQARRVRNARNNFQHLRLGLRGRRGAFSTSIDVCGSVAPGTPLRFLVAGATLAAPQHPFVWLAWPFEHEHRCLRKRGAWDAAAFSGGRRDACRSQHPFAWLAAAFCGGRRNACSTSASFRGRRGVFSPSIDVCGSVAPGTPPRFVVPGVILAATQPRFAWTALRFQYAHRCVRKCGAWDAVAFSGGRGDACSASASFCVADVALSIGA